MTYKEYIISKADRIGADQPSFNLLDTYDIDRLRTINNPFFQQRVDELLTVSLNRKYVFYTFTKNDYTGFVATMLWGGLGSDSYTWRYLVKAMEADKPDIEFKIFNLRSLLENGNIREAFISLQRNPNIRFDGVGVSFFTKLLYFLYNEKKGLRPIIFDKWGKYIHLALLIDDHQFDMIDQYYSIKHNKGKWTIGLKCNRQNDLMYATYADYCNRMGVLSDHLVLENPGVLEEFLFGKELRHRDNKNNDNPRYFVKNYVDGHLPSLTR